MKYYVVDKLSRLKKDLHKVDNVLTIYVEHYSRVEIESDYNEWYIIEKGDLVCFDFESNRLLTVTKVIAK